MRRNYIGLANSFHDSAVAIVDSHGEVVFAESTERPLQSKRALCIAPDLVHHAGEIVRRYCEPGAEIVVARSWTDASVDAFPHAALHSLESERDTLARRYGNIPSGLRTELISTRHGLLSMWKARAFAGQNIEIELDRIGWDRPFIARQVGYDHHLTHAVTACFSSPFDEALCAVVDGLGEARANACYAYRNGILTPIETSSVNVPAVGYQGLGSLGLFYLKVCLACGFGVLTGEEWKVMGLAAYGKPDEALLEFFRRMVHVVELGFSANGDPIQERLRLYEFRERSLHSEDFAADVAFAGQRVFSERLTELLTNLSHVGDSRNLVLSGGCALNSSASGEIVGRTEFDRLHVFSAPADDGNAIGAALLAFLDDHPGFRPRCSVLTPYLGSEISTETLGNLIRFARPGQVLDFGPEAPRRAAEMLAAGKIIGWVRGRAEFGPRALGNRSILADPRSRDVKVQINSRVKFREKFRPFAPAILHDYAPEYFEDYQESPYMERTLKFRPEVVNKVPGVVHVDGTGRLQTVKKEWNNEFYELIDHFRKLTGIPVVLNTSFNVMGKPISHSVEDVLAVLHSSGLDGVFLENHFVSK
jgi:carbamoyltransferase